MVSVCGFSRRRKYCRAEAEKELGWFEECNGTDESGFNAVPGGIRDGAGSYYDIIKFSCLWSSTASSETTAWYFFLIHNFPDVAKFEGAKERGLSVRLVKD